MIEFLVKLSPHAKLACLAYLLILIGFVVRNYSRKSHIVLMNLGIALDLSLVLALEFQRNAIATALSFELDWLQQLHIFTSSIATFLYFPLVITGFIKIFKKKQQPRLKYWHKNLGIAAFFFRTAGFFLMFSM